MSVLFILILLVSEVKGIDIRMNPIKEASSLYYEFQGETYIFNTEWRLVTYMNISDLKLARQQLANYVKTTSALCKREELSVREGTLCTTTVDKLLKRLRVCERTQGLIDDLMDVKVQRKKRSIWPLNIIGQISKVLFGTMDEDDASFYNEKISQVEKEQLDFLTLSKEQITIVKSTLTMINRTMRDVTSNQKMLSQSLEKVIQEVNSRNTKVANILSQQNLKLLIEEHIALLSVEIDLLRDQVNIIMDAIVDAIKGILNPYIISSEDIVKHFKSFSVENNVETELLVPNEKMNLQQILRVATIDIYSAKAILCYVIKLPLSEHFVFDTYKIVPIPSPSTQLKGSYIYIKPSSDLILMEKARQYYVKLSLREFDKCKRVLEKKFICKQTFPLISMYDKGECEARLLRDQTVIPEDCIKQITNLINTLWIPIGVSEWLYVAPKEERMTINCKNGAPFDVKIEGRGKLTFLENCKGYSTSILLTSQSELTSNRTNKDLILDLPVFDCCEDESFKVDEDVISMSITVRPIINQLNNLHIASHKVSEVEKEIEQEKWKILHSTQVNKLSVLSYIVTCVVVIIVFMCLCKKCGCKKWFWNNLWNKCARQTCGCCTSICIKPTIVNNVNTNPNLPVIQEENRMYDSMQRDAPMDLRMSALNSANR